MSTFTCGNCGGTTFEVIEHTPRRREIQVVLDRSGQPVEADYNGEGYDELDYELSTFVGYACGDCHAEAKTLKKLGQKVVLR